MKDTLKVWRVRRELNQTQLAHKLGMGRDRLVRIEHGYQEPTPEEKVKIANTLQAPLEDILFPAILK
jgi:DNA-binding XRE family transcriptional regulator